MSAFTKPVSKSKRFPSGLELFGNGCPAVNKHWTAIKQQMADTNAEFLLHGGDLTRDDEIHEFEYLQAKEDLETLPFPAFVIPGNMDVGNQHTAKNGVKRKWDDHGLGWHDPDLNMTAERLDLFASYFGPIHWTFLYREVCFTGFSPPSRVRGCLRNSECGGCWNDFRISRPRSSMWR